MKYIMRCRCPECVMAIVRLRADSPAPEPEPVPVQVKPPTTLGGQDFPVPWQAPPPACSVPFAFESGRTVSEKFLVQIETEETGEYCGCFSCKEKRRACWLALINNRLKGTNPFKLFPETHKVTVTPEA